jgi:hypothetical protein
MGNLDPVVLATLLGLATIAWFCLISVVRAFSQRRAYQSALAMVQSGTQPPIVAYQRYLRSSNVTPRWARIGNSIGTFAVAAGVAAIVLKGRWETLGTADFMPYRQAVLLLLLLATVAGTSAPILLAVLTAIWSSAPARSNLRGLPIRPSDLVRQRVKTTFVYTITNRMLWLMSLALIFFGSPLWIGAVAGCLCQLLFTTFRAANGPAILRWLYPSTPIEETDWAPLGQRIQAWAQLAGRPLHAINVQHMALNRSADWSIVGFGRQTLFISDVFLASTDWRQRDAYVGLMLGLAPIYQLRERLQFILIGGYWLAIAASFGCLWYSLDQILMSPSSSVLDLNSSTTIFGPDNIQMLYSLLLCFLVACVFMILSRQLNRPVTKHYLDGDRFSTELVGDPLALLAALYLVWNYPSGNLFGLLTTNSTIQERVAALHRRLSAPGPFAPWAFRPIPASIPVMLGPDLVSVPLTPQALAEQPKPIPTTRYPISEPQALAALSVDTRSVADSPTIPTLSFNSES